LKAVNAGLGVMVVAWLAIPAQAEWASTRVAVYVGSKPSWKAPVVDHLKRGDEVDILEVKGDWARISPFRPPEEEGLRGRKPVARWVSVRHLATRKPAPLPTEGCEHPDIAPGALAKGGPGYGLTVEEAAVLCRGARHLLATGRCARVEYGDKSLSRPGTFFVNCGGSNLFFTAADLPPDE
jgi:hypothetical protein